MGRGEVHVGIWWENLRERYHFENKRRSGSIKLALKQEEGRDWMNLAYDRDKWQSVVNRQ